MNDQKIDGVIELLDQGVADETVAKVSGYNLDRIIKLKRFLRLTGLLAPIPNN